MEKMAKVDLKFLRNDAEYFCIEGLVKIVDEEIEKTEKKEALRIEQLKRVDENVTKIGSEIGRIAVIQTLILREFSSKTKIQITST